LKGLSYAKLAEVSEQWPIVGRGDLYYGGTTYENTQGLGAQLVSAAERGETVSIPEVREEAGLRPKEDELLAVPVTKLYDRGTTVTPATLLTQSHRGRHDSPAPEAARKLGLEAGNR
jgi:NADH-quinone oxidoreductase subunit G